MCEPIYIDASGLSIFLFIYVLNYLCTYIFITCKLATCKLAALCRPNGVMSKGQHNILSNTHFEQIVLASLLRFAMNFLSRTLAYYRAIHPRDAWELALR